MFEIYSKLTKKSWWSKQLFTVNKSLLSGEFFIGAIQEVNIAFPWMSISAFKNLFIEPILAQRLISLLPKKRQKTNQVF